jgi:hypothetical protein
MARISLALRFWNDSLSVGYKLQRYQYTYYDAIGISEFKKIRIIGGKTVYLLYL